MAQNFVIKPGVLFEDEEIPQQGQVQQVAERIKARVDTRRNALLQMCNRIVRTDVWARAYADLQQLELEFGGPLQTRWNTAYGSNDRANIINVLRDCEAKLLAFEGQHEGAFVLAEHGLATQCVFRCIRSAVPGASDQDSGHPIRIRSEATSTGAGQAAGWVSGWGFRPFWRRMDEPRRVST